MTVDGPQIGAGMPETAERDGAFPRLDEGQMSRLRLLGERRAVEPGDVLFEAGDAEQRLLRDRVGGGGHRPGLRRGEPRHRGPRSRTASSGELRLLTGQRLYLTGVVRDAGEVIQVPRGEAPRDRRRGQGAQRRDPRRVHRPPLDPDRRRNRDQADRLAVLPRLPAAARVPGPQPHAPSVDRPRGGRARRTPCSAASPSSRARRRW